MAIVWLILLVAFLLVEAATVSVLCLWFAAGSLVALTASLLGAELWLQAVLFLAVSGVLLGALRPMVKKYFTPRLTRTNVDSAIGATGIVTQRIDNLASCGQVKLGAMEWTARSATGAPIEAGTRVSVERVEGVKLFVTPVQVCVGEAK